MAGPDSEPPAIYDSVPYRRVRPDEAESTAAAEEFLAKSLERRSVRAFSSEPVSPHLVDLAIETANSAPSGANMQPWTFVVVRDPEVKRRIREAAEEEERKNYSGRMTEEWIRALEPLGTDWRKEFLEVAPLLIVVFRQDYHVEEGRHVKHYYVTESVGIATGFLLAALNNAGLSTLTHTPSPMGFLREILERPEWERPFLLIPVGYPSEDCRVPDIRKKPLDEVRIVR